MSFSRTLTTVSTLGMLALALAFTACGDDSGNGGASCAQVCAKATAANCANDPDCMKSCNDAKRSTPNGCTSVYNAFTSCLAGATFSCDAQGESEAKACSKQQSAYSQCVVSGGKDTGDQDGGDTQGTVDASMSEHQSDAGGASSGSGCGGTLPASDCEACVQQSCCDDLLACRVDTDCVTLTQCLGDCDDSTCEQACADASSQAGVDAYNTYLGCASDHCTSDCSDGTTTTADAGAGESGGSDDIGAPNDGNQGHASTTTPPNCLDVPTDETGYCGEVKYKVIYDCPDAAPYADCELNMVDAHGIYCCGH